MWKLKDFKYIKRALACRKEKKKEEVMGVVPDFETHNQFLGMFA